MPRWTVDHTSEASGTTASRNATHTSEVTTRSLAWRRFSTRAAMTYVPRTCRIAAISAHWTLLCRPAAALTPSPRATDPAAMAHGAHLGRWPPRRVLGRLAAREGVVLMRWPPSTPCGGR
ncbi:hypothetical protein SVIOM74S_10287 [Streptomyces violarus]